MVDKVASYYLRLLLAWADNFYRVQIEYEVVRLDIIAVQATNRASALKNALNRIQNCKAKKLEQLEIIAIIKNNNI